MLSLTDRLDEDRLFRLAINERKANEGCDYPDSLDFWVNVVRKYELRRAVHALAVELEYASESRTPDGEPDVEIMEAALRGVRDAINAYEEMTL